MHKFIKQLILLAPLRRAPQVGVITYSALAPGTPADSHDSADDARDGSTLLMTAMEQKLWSLSYFWQRDSLYGGTLNPSNAETTFVQRQGRKDFKNHLNPVMLVFVR